MNRGVVITVKTEEGNSQLWEKERVIHVGLDGKQGVGDERRQLRCSLLTAHSALTFHSITKWCIPKYLLFRCPSHAVHPVVDIVGVAVSVELNADYYYRRP